MKRIRRKLAKGMFILRDKMYKILMESNKISTYDKAIIIRKKLEDESKLLYLANLENCFRDFVGVPKYVDKDTLNILYIMAVSDIIRFVNLNQTKN